MIVLSIDRLFQSIGQIRSLVETYGKNKINIQIGLKIRSEKGEFLSLLLEIH